MTPQTQDKSPEQLYAEYVHNMEISRRDHEFSLESQKISFEATIGFATLAIKSLLLYNGGAIIGILSFYGNVISRSEKLTQEVIWASQLGNALSWYIYGVIAALICSFFAYVTQMSITEEDNDGKWNLANWWRLLGILSALFSLACFILGCLDAAKALQIQN